MKKIILFFLFVSCSSLKPQHNVEVKEDLTYSKESSRNIGDLYLPKSEVLKPVVLLIHGGMWANHDKKSMSHYAKKIAGQGFAVFAVNYRLAPENKYPAQLEDLKAASHWLRDNAEKYKLDSNKMAVYGYSSGGHLASLLALIGDRDAAGVNQIPFQAVVAGATPFNLEKFEDQKALKRLLKEEEDKSKASPIQHVTNDAPDFFIFHSKNDWVVKYEQSLEFIEELEKHKVGYEFYSIPALGHTGVFSLSGKALDQSIAFLKEKLMP